MTDAPAEAARAADAFEQARADVAPDRPELVVDVDGFEGPLDLLLELARRHKLDLARISILALAEQYLAYVERARSLRLELAADYLVMAAWLAYLKSRLLLPEKVSPEEPSAEELAGDLARRLRRLEALREAARLLGGRDRLGRDVFARGMPESMDVVTRPRWQASLHDLLVAYATERQKQARARVTLARRVVLSLAEARDLLSRLVGRDLGWAPLDVWLAESLRGAESRATIRASSFAASLEMAREGLIELRQDAPFAPLLVRGRPVPREVAA